MTPRLNRQKVLKEAKILSNDTSLTCLIENLSEGGAALILPDHYAPSPRFVLTSSALQERLCEVVWQRANLVGVKFVDRVDTAIPQARKTGEAA
jgi:hypothetical protein